MEVTFRNILKKFLSLFFVAIISVYLYAQQEDEELRPIDRLFFGGNFGFQFGTFTNIEISPLVGYNITPRIAAGTGIRYEYFHDKGYYGTFKTSIYGSNIFSRYLLIRNLGEGIKLNMNAGIFTQMEYELLSLEKEYFEPPYSEDGRFLLYSILVGGGIIQPIGSRSAFLVTILYNLNEDYRSPYSNPIVRIGFTF